MINRFFSNKPLVSIVFVLIFFVGVLMGPLVFGYWCHNNLNLINPNLKCDERYAIDKSEYIVLKNKISDYILEKQEAKEITKAAVYFRDLENGPIMGINEKESFVPASLLKLPVMLTYFSLLERKPDFLEKKLSFSPNTNQKEPLEQFFKPSKVAEPNREYSLEELIANMIIYSDNVSYTVLLENLRNNFSSENLVLETMRDLGLIEPSSYSDETISAKSYASIFRMLYNASYLSREFSEKALEILTKTDFNDGLVASLPKDIKVAHKFGERFNLPEGHKELHDCGIVYFPKNPYLICIMTEGYEFPKLTEAIKDISKMVFDEVNSRKL